jgi:hypothetical protein
MNCWSSLTGSKEAALPVDPRKSVGENIREFKTGPRFAHTERKFGPERAKKQALAVALHTKDEDEDWRDAGKKAKG